MEFTVENMDFMLNVPSMLTIKVGWSDFVDPSFAHCNLNYSLASFSIFVMYLYQANMLFNM